jgi:hypothetical protein
MGHVAKPWTRHTTGLASLRDAGGLGLTASGGVRRCASRPPANGFETTGLEMTRTAQSEECQPHVRQTWLAPTEKVWLEPSEKTMKKACDYTSAMIENIVRIVALATNRWQFLQ